MDVRGTPGCTDYAGRIPPGGDLVSCVPGVVDVAVHVDPGSGRLRDVDRFGGSLLGAQPASENSAVPGRVRPGDGTRRHIGREGRVNPGDRAPDARLERGHAGHGRRLTAVRGLAERGRDRRVRWQVERVHDWRIQSCGEDDRGRVEGVIVDQVVTVLPDRGVGAGKGRLGQGRVGARRAGGPVQGGGQGPRVDPGINDRDPWYLRSGGRVHVDRVAPAGQAPRKIGYEGLRASPWGSRMADTSGAMIATFIR